LLEKLRELTTMSVEQRLIIALCRMAEFDAFARHDGCLVLNTSDYRLLCELVGATRESVSLVISRFSAEGLIEKKGGSLLIQPDRLVQRMEELPMDDLFATTTSITGAQTAVV
jgi:CRP-like cAMP-binding protein